MEKSKKKIYLDHASATPMDPNVVSAMVEIFKKDFANSSAIHDLGMKTKKILEQARKNIAEILGAHSDEIIFTSGATESNNLAIIGVVKKFAELFFKNRAYSPAGELLCSARQPAQCFSKNTQRIFSQVPHIVTTNVEHSSVLEACRYLEGTKQAEVTYVPVEANGIVDPKKIKKALKPNTVLVSVMYANNEIGTIQPIQEIAKEIRHYKKAKSKKQKAKSYPVFHTDATQAINYLPIKVEKLGIDLMSFNSGKIYGPKGVGVLYAKRKTPISKIMFGGDQEFGLRPGTENVAGISGLTEALKITEKIKEKEAKRLTKLRDYFLQKLYDLKNQNSKFSRVLGLGPDQLENFSFDFSVNGDLKNRLPNNLNITFPKIPSDLLVLELSARGIYISEKSACKSGDKEGSYVIEALGRRNFLRPSLRFSLGRQTTKPDIDYVLKSLSEILKKLKKWYT